MRIVFIADIPYDYPLKQRPQYLFDGIGAEHEAVYASPRFRLHYHSGFPLVRMLSRRLAWFHWFFSLVQYVFLLRWHRPDWVFIESIQLVGLVRLLRPKRIWFDYIDNAFGFGELPEYCSRDFLWLTRNADITSATNEGLRVRPDTIILPNGIDLEKYRHYIGGRK